MAAAVIPIISSIISVLGPLVPSIVQGVETLFGPKTGDTKMQTAVSMLQKAAEALAAAGKIQGVPDVSTLATMVENAVQALKAQGQLPAPTTVPATTAASTTLPSGTRVVLVGTLQVLA